MGFSANNYMKIWKVERKEKFTKLNLSSSRKNRDTGEYETDFSGFANMIGAAHKKAENLEEGDRIKITACDVTTRYDKAKDTKFTNFVIFDYEPAGSPAAETKPVSETKNEDVEEDSDDLPF